jgi:hypothetical protein
MLTTDKLENKYGCVRMVEKNPSVVNYMRHEYKIQLALAIMASQGAQPRLCHGFRCEFATMRGPVQSSHKTGERRPPLQRGPLTRTSCL